MVSTTAPRPTDYVATADASPHPTETNDSDGDASSPPEEPLPPPPEEDNSYDEVMAAFGM